MDITTKKNDINKIRIFNLLRQLFQLTIIPSVFYMFVASAASQASELNGSVFTSEGLVWMGDMQTIPESSNGGGSKAESSVKTEVITENVNYLVWGRVDGYYGIIIAPGIVAVLDGYSNVKGGTGGVYDYISNVSFDFYSDPLPSAQNSAQRVAYSNGSVVYKLSSSSGEMTWTRIYSSRVRGGIYISKSAKAGSYSYPKILISNGTNSSIFGEAGSFRYRPYTLECTALAPPTIDFGPVIGKGDGWVPIANRDSILNVNCSSDSANAEATATISFTGSALYYDRSEMLEMTTDGSYGIGILNGRYGQGNISNCSSVNTNNDDAVKFDGTVSKTLELNTGTNEIPITWTVCRRGDVQQFGNVSAQATANINWD